MQKVKEFLLTDIRLLNGFVLVIVSILFLTFVGYMSYTLTNARAVDNSDIIISIK